ncbi:MAG: lip [Frankiales bacterium]|nr:lip [Frankiales bacterium]
MPLDPTVAFVLDLMNTNGTASMVSGTPEQAREGFRAMTVGNRDVTQLAQVGRVTDRTIPGPAGPIPVRTYFPVADGPHPTVVFFHGGGFVIGDLDTHDDHARLLCRDVDAVVVSVDYRLAPEAPFPAGYEDCVAAYRWVVDSAADLGGDVTRIAVAGDSAGGNLAAGVALAARDAGLPLAAQLLIYPCVEFVESDDYPSRVENAEGYFLSAADMRWFGDHYLQASPREDPRASVLRAADLAGVAPAVVGTGEYDPLRDEGEAFAAALEKAGVPVVARRYDGLIHGFFGLGFVSPACAAATSELCAELRRLLDR